MRYKLTIAYDGTAYEGWQLQTGQRQPKTVQGAVEAALLALVGRRVPVTCAGRTDAGVHALAQTAHADLPERDWDWRRRINALLPPDIRIVDAQAAPEGFHARKNAIARTYYYNFWLDSAFISPFWHAYAWQCGPVHVENMRAALWYFAGRHDFASFQNSGTPQSSTEREIHELRLEMVRRPAFADMEKDAPMLRLTICADGFLKQMVRNIAGCLAAIGKNRLEPDALPAILAARDRRALPAATAPARGLFLHSVEYSDPHTKACGLPCRLR